MKPTPIEVVESKPGTTWIVPYDGRIATVCDDGASRFDDGTGQVNVALQRGTLVLADLDDAPK